MLYIFLSFHALRHEQATYEAVLDSLPAYPIIHWSSHEATDLDEPLNSAFVMANDTHLTLRDLLGLHLRVARFALLSACETGMMVSKLPDEMMSLPSGSLQAGSRGSGCFLVYCE